MTQTLTTTDITSLPRLARGKVRDIYAIDNQHLLLIATDRLSAFDVILPTPVPDKGRVLTEISRFWFHKLAHVLPNHLTEKNPADFVRLDEVAQVAGRSMVVRRLTPLPVEAVVRGYLAGSGWNDYRRTGSVCGIALPAGLQLAQELPQPLFTPSTKAAVGAHDENISFQTAENLLGAERAAQVRDMSLALYREAAAWARARGIIIADTKFEFGTDENGTLYLIDEALTPDSSRFWPLDQYQAGSQPPSFDKQFVRDWLEASGWNKTPPAPELPADIIQKTADKYQEAARQLQQPSA
jgi:phosphoribosylaminoimidazole-succinocarboxamide synthase